ncbi:hypothetical protein LTR08_001028 [Meristemomyces frigidus]|nr:hypothetical protein LTR08_001028 [Meristemomyces frigidus]
MLRRLISQHAGVQQAGVQHALSLVRPFTTSTTPLLKEKPLPPRLKIDEAELDEAFLKGSGPGGQKINKTSSAVQLKHGPSGIVVKCQETRSRQQNRKLARQILAEKLDHIEKGDESRTSIKIERVRAKKASASKKKGRKYRKLEEEKAEGREADVGRHEEAGGRDENNGSKGLREQILEGPEALCPAAAINKLFLATCELLHTYLPKALPSQHKIHGGGSFDEALISQELVGSLTDSMVTMTFDMREQILDNAKTLWSICGAMAPNNRGYDEPAPLPNFAVIVSGEGTTMRARLVYAGDTYGHKTVFVVGPEEATMGEALGRLLGLTVVLLNREAATELGPGPGMIWKCTATGDVGYFCRTSQT